LHTVGVPIISPISSLAKNDNAVFCFSDDSCFYSYYYMVYDDRTVECYKGEKTREMLGSQTKGIKYDKYDNMFEIVFLAKKQKISKEKYDELVGMAKTLKNTFDDVECTSFGNEERDYFLTMENKVYFMPSYVATIDYRYPNYSEISDLARKFKIDMKNTVCLKPDKRPSSLIIWKKDGDKYKLGFNLALDNMF
jgi:hypothetical protein